MDHATPGETTSDTASDTTSARRRRMRAHARGLHPGSSPEAEGYLTPQWLDRSFVLPLTRPETTDVPSQPTPHHDDFDSFPEEPLATSTGSSFVRPPTADIDFSRVIRRSDLSRTASRTTIAASGIAGLTLVLYLLTMSMLVLVLAIVFGVVALLALLVRIRLAAMPIRPSDQTRARARRSR